MDLSKRKRPISFVFFTAVLLSNAVLAAQDEPWVSLKKAGQVADVGADYNKAAKYYEKALKEATTKDQSQILDLEARLATDYVHLFKFDLAEPLTRHILLALPELKRSKKYDPEVLVSVKFLSEAYRQTYGGSLPMAQRQKNFHQFEGESIYLADLLGLNYEEMYARHYDRYRQYIYFGERNQADAKLAELVQKIPKTSPMYETTELAQAAVEWGAGRPQMLERLQRELSKKCNEGLLLTRIGRAHVYAANYLEADKVLGKALVVLEEQRPPNYEMLIEAHRVLMSSYDDRNLFAKSEPHARKIIDLVAVSKGTKSDEYTKAVNRYVFYLNSLNKPAEAKKWKAKIPSNFDWLLDDEKPNVKAKSNH
ncbi:MAG: hypothetical protein HYX67_05305 [Candidatus Melainabacteria bacterium]|nr:hypothetical protein [Candidatus Melainabacteria bacterium]